ncbi:MAG: hypothetical protein ACT4PE_14220 [Candidatus Eiseniibacteriota bacterium]
MPFPEEFAPLPVAGEVRALFILVSFPDEPTSGGCVPDPWPHDPDPGTAVPAWAPLLLEETVPPQAGSGSLTNFFWLMSAGQHALTGKTYSKVVTLTAGMSYYLTDPDGSGPLQPPSLAAATRDAILAVDSDPEIDFSDFDAYPLPSGDGVVDFVFVYYRQKHSGTPLGSLTVYGGLGLLSLTSPVTVDSGPDQRTVVSSNGVELFPDNVLRGPAACRGTALHEYGHHLVSCLVS